MPGVGIDLLEIARLERALKRTPKLALRLFTDEERRYAGGQARPVQHLAARFCAKEAAAKAMTLAWVPWQDMSVVSGEDGAPRLVLRGSLAGRDETLAVSLTHTRRTAGAVVIAGG